VIADRVAAGWKPFGSAGAESAAQHSELVTSMLAAMARAAGRLTTESPAPGSGVESMLDSVLAQWAQDALFSLECRAWKIALGGSSENSPSPVADSWVRLASCHVAGSMLASPRSPAWQHRLGGAALTTENPQVDLPRYAMARDGSGSLGMPGIPAGAILEPAGTTPAYMRIDVSTLAAEGSAHEDEQ
jgi:hypothetical protein